MSAPREIRNGRSGNAPLQQCSPQGNQSCQLLNLQWRHYKQRGGTDLVSATSTGGL